VNGNTLTLQSNYAPPASGGVLDAGNNANSIVVFNGNADFTMNGTFNATNITGLSIGGDLITSELETWNNYANIDLSVVASTALFSLPSAITQLRRITLNRANGMKINADLTLGEDALGNPYNGTVLSINNGDFDLNGFNTTLADANNVIYESASGGQIVVNSGADSAYITTCLAGSTVAQIINSGIGIGELLGEPLGVIVKRFPNPVSIPKQSVSMRLFLNSANDNKWDNPGNWSPNGVPESTDGVIIGNFTVYLNGNSNSFKCKNLYLTDGKSKLIPYTSDSFGSLLKLKNVTINNIGNNNFTPIGNIEIQGDFTYNNGAIANNGSFLPQNGSVIFSGPTDKYLNNYANADEVKFYNIEINKKASVYTYSSFSIRGNFTLRIDCRFKAEAGTVYFIDDDVPSAIINENGR